MSHLFQIEDLYMTEQLAANLSSLLVLLNLLVAMTNFERYCVSWAAGNVGYKAEQTGKGSSTLLSMFTLRGGFVYTRRPGAFAFAHVSWRI